MPLKSVVNERYFKLKKNRSLILTGFASALLVIYFVSITLGTDSTYLVFEANFLPLLSSWLFLGALLHLWEAKDSAVTINLWTEHHSTYILVLSFISIIIQIFTFASVIFYPISNLSLLLALLVDLVLFIAFTGFGYIPYVDTIWWVIIFSISLVVGLLFIEVGTNVSGMAVEITGTLIGLFAAIALGEVLKGISTWSSMRTLSDSIIDELLDVHEELAADRPDPIPIPVWTACVADGRLLDLKYWHRRDLTKIYREIEFFNIHRTSDHRVNAKAAIEDFFPSEKLTLSDTEE